MAAYDAVWVIGLNASYQKNAPRNSKHDILSQTAGIYFGATGWTQLNAAGDRALGDYDFWAIRPDATGKLAWKVICHHDSISGAQTGESCGPEHN